MRYENYLGYVAGPYTAPTEKQVQLNIDVAEEASAELWRMQFPNLCPHKSAAHFERPEWNIPAEYFYPGTIIMLSKCDFMVLANSNMAFNERSRGTMGEIQYCIDHGMPWFKSVEEFKQYVKFSEEQLENNDFHIFSGTYRRWRSISSAA